MIEPPAHCEDNGNSYIPQETVLSNHPAYKHAHFHNRTIIEFLGPIVGITKEGKLLIHRTEFFPLQIAKVMQDITKKINRSYTMYNLIREFFIPRREYQENYCLRIIFELYLMRKIRENKELVGGVVPVIHGAETA